jgi:glyoxylase-like metal-dependent hydrolase (beta-lactamase superfamily II)
MKDFLVVVEAPVDDRHALWLLEALRRAHPDKPVKYLVLTHHHLDHSSGLRSYFRAGAILAVAQGDEAFFRQVLNSPHTRNAPVPEPVGAGARILEVGPQPLSITDGSREVKLYPIANPHVQGMLMGYLPDQRLGFVADLWSPGRDPLGTKPSPGEAAVVAAVRQYGLDPLRFAGAHGSVADYADLAKIATP